MDRSFTIPSADRRIAAAGVAQVLAATGVLWMKTQGFHWNAEGGEGVVLGLLLGPQAEDLRRALAPLSLRIRALGFYAPAALADFIALSPVREEAGVPVPREMAGRLGADHSAVAALIRCIRPALEDIGDTASCALLDHRLGQHESAAASFSALQRECPPDGVITACVRDSLIIANPAEFGVGENDGGAAPR